MHILVVDDETLPREGLKDLLESCRHTAEMAENGRDALEKLHSASLPFDLVITDVDMPVMNGLDLLLAIKEDEKLRDIPAIVFTASKLSKSLVEHLGYHFVSKPNNKELLAAIERIVLKSK